MTESIDEILKNTPSITSFPVSMDEVNQPISIYEGDFQLRHEDKIVTVTGKIFYNWFPTLGSKFSGVAINTSIFEIFPLFDAPEKSELIIDGLSFGDATITGAKEWPTGASVEGTIPYAIKGYRSIPVTKVRFAIPNLRDFNGGAQTKEFFETSDRINRTRIIFENDNYLIVIDKRGKNEEHRKNLKNKGGFFLLYSGELTKKKGDINLKELKDVFRCFSNFLWFLNGRRCSPLFIQGTIQDKEIWTDYSKNLVDQYKYVITWPMRYSIEGLNELWQNFSNDWKNKDDKNFLIYAIHWYVEANSNSGFAEGAIIMAQTALELIYNYLIIEKKKLLTGKDAANILASNKIRLLLSQLNLDFEIPKGFTQLQSIAKILEVDDAPEIFVRVRNAIVHSQESKRKELTNMQDEVKHEALQLGLWYIELSLLYILKFEGKYFNRTLTNYSSLDPNEVFVPWKKIN